MPLGGFGLMVSVAGITWAVGGGVVGVAAAEGDELAGTCACWGLEGSGGVGIVPSKPLRNELELGAEPSGEVVSPLLMERSTLCGLYQN